MATVGLSIGVPSAMDARVFCGAPSSENMLVGYYNEMVKPKPFRIHGGDEFRRHQQDLRERILRDVGLSPLPERVPLELTELATLDHPWCTVCVVSYQVWPGVRLRALLYTPREFQDKPAPAMLCPHGHWADGNAHPVVQTRCLNFARLGYVVLSTIQYHYEDLAIGFSHQTLHIWNNMRGLDLLQSLPDVDGRRIGCAGASGGGMQTQMIAALDPRVQAVVILGLTCSYREQMAPYSAQCPCTHWPRVMQYTDQPEIAALALPRPVQFHTMNDFTKNFGRDNWPQIQALYEANGVGDRAEHHYWPTQHTYDRPKRERTYAWMERWLRGRSLSQPVNEPETETFAPEQLSEKLVDAPPEGTPADKFPDVALDPTSRHRIRTLYTSRCANSRTSSAAFASAEVARQREILKRLLGMEAALPRSNRVFRGPTERYEETCIVPFFPEYEGKVIERYAFPCEGPVFVPTLVLGDRDSHHGGVHLFCDDRPKEIRMGFRSPEVIELVRSGGWVVFPDVRFVGALSLERLKGHSRALVEPPIAEDYFGEVYVDEKYSAFWTRNAILWGRPLPGMAATDILATIDGVLASLDQEGPVTLTARGSIAVAALFAACLDDRISRLDIDLGTRNFADGSLPLVPDILRYGDVDHWMSLARVGREQTDRTTVL